MIKKTSVALSIATILALSGCSSKKIDPKDDIYIGNREIALFLENTAIDRDIHVVRGQSVEQVVSDIASKTNDRILFKGPKYLLHKKIAPQTIYSIDDFVDWLGVNYPEATATVSRVGGYKVFTLDSSILIKDKLEKQEYAISSLASPTQELEFLIKSVDGTLVMENGTAEILQKKRLNYSGNGLGFIEYISKSYDVDFTFKGNSIILSVMSKETFEIDMPALKFSMSSQTSLSTSSSDGTMDDKGDTTAKTDLEMNLFDDLSEAIANIIDNTPSNGEFRSHFNINRSNGMISVTTRPSSMAKVREVIYNFNQTYARSIEITMEIYEIVLSDEFSAGVDFNILKEEVGATQSASLGFSTTNPTLLSTTSLSFNRAGNGLTQGVVLNALKKFGKTETRSSPKIRAINNTPAHTVIGTQMDYLKELSATLSQSGDKMYSTKMETVTDGLNLLVIPKIVGNEILLILQPKLNRLLSMDTINLGEGSKVQALKKDAKESSYTVRIARDETVVIGGLIMEKEIKSKSGLPWIKRVAGFFDYLGGAKVEETEKRELIIAVNARIL